ncbi:14346_t:CDS:1, partial [Racocetra fulgida]
PTASDLIKDLELYCRIVDKLLLTKDLINDDEILAMVHDTFDPAPVVTDSEEDNMPLAFSVSLSEAINALHTLVRFQEQRESNDGFKPEELDLLRKKIYYFEKLKNASKKQTDLLLYFGDKYSGNLE